MKLKEETLVVNDFHVFSNEEYEGLEIRWVANIGFGSVTIYKEKTSDCWQIDDEFMGKDFVKTLLSKAVEDFYEKEE